MEREIAFVLAFAQRIRWDAQGNGVCNTNERETLTINLAGALADVFRTKPARLGPLGEPRRSAFDG